MEKREKVSVLGKGCLRALFGAFMAVLLVACSETNTGPGEPGGGGATVSLAADVQPVFDAHCLGCHGPGGNGGLDLSAEVAWANLVGVETTNYAPRQRVVSANPGESVLFLKISAAAAVGASMPPGAPLPADAIELVRIWIAQGALDN